MTAPPLVQEALLPDDLLAAFESQVSASPGHGAVSAGDCTLSAGELNARANRLARHLQAQGARPGVYIGVGLGRSVELIVALLAVSTVVALLGVGLAAAAWLRNRVDARKIEPIDS